MPMSPLAATVAETCTFSGCTVEKDTGKAILVKCPDWEKPLWIPKSQIDEDSEVYEADTAGDLVISQWLAEQKGLV